MNKNFSPEAILINKQERGSDSEEHEINLNIAYKKAVELLNEERISQDEFRDLYKSRIIKEHGDYVEQRQQKFKIDNTPEQIEAQKYAIVFEAIIHDQIDMNGWLGEHATAQKASWYDDLKNGIDEIIEFEQTETSSTSHLALGVDITFGKGIIDKMDSIKKRIDKGNIGVIQYLLTDTYRGEMKNVPRVIIGVDMKNLNEIIKLWVDNKKRSLAQHHVKFLIISQIEMQLNDFAEYAKKRGKTTIADSYGRVLKIVQNIRDEEEKKYPGESNNINFGEDRVCSDIQKYCNSLNEEKAGQEVN
ncbi:MAG: hypothetical protein WCV70_01300 [Patescibacteria group bacterium]|jgi:hypothetical protein